MDENRPMTKKERKLAARAEKAAIYKEEGKQNVVKWGIIGLASVVFLAFFGFLIFIAKQNNPITTSEPVAIAEDSGWIMGSGATGTSSASLENAAVTLVEFGDLQCPACKFYHPVVKELLAGYEEGQIKFIFKHFPLTSIHPHAMAAAIAAEAAGNQGKFFEYHDLLYDNQEAWSGLTAADAEARFIEYAQNLELDIDKFNAERKDSALEAKVRVTMEEGISLGVNATPSFFVNGSKIANPASVEDFRAIIDEKLRQ